MGKAFAAWFLGGSLWLALVPTLQLGFALSQFGAQEYVTQIVTWNVISRDGATLVIFAAGNTLVMVTHRRAKATILQPVPKLHLWIPACLGFTTPLAMALICGWSVAISTFFMGVPWADSSKHLGRTLHFTDFAGSILSVLVGATLVVVLAPQMMRLLIRFQGWLILKFIIVMQVTRLALAVVGLVWKAIVSP